MVITDWAMKIQTAKLTFYKSSVGEMEWNIQENDGHPRTKQFLAVICGI